MEFTPAVMLSKVKKEGDTFMMISEVSEKFGISQDTLRYYERIGLIPPINRNTTLALHMYPQAKKINLYSLY
ncbi:HTH-type transcriptional regulator AdhR [Mycobacteroides abscessus subsp. abscessus]|nr:HTH-type transcriptional regulator AdhR [Mycobacteroides abscessus subsp. abscessus]